MHTTSFNHEQRQIQGVSLWPFLLITFGVGWGILGLFILLPEQAAHWFGELTGQHPLFFLAVWAPAIAAFAIVIHKAGFGGLGRFVSRLLVWRCSLPWYAFLLVVIPSLFFAGPALKGNLFAEPFPFQSFPALLAALAFTAIKGPIEEFGWRGLALPLLQRRFAPIWAGLIVGVIWGLWHLPAFLLSGTPQSAWSFTPFLAGSIAMSVMMTALFNASRGSIFLPALFHFQANNPIWPDAQPYDTLFFVAATVLVVWFNRTAMFNQAGAVTEAMTPPGFAPTGGRIAFETAEFSHFEGGLIAHHNVVLNMLDMARQIGALPQAGSLGDRMGLWLQHIAAHRTRARQGREAA